MMKTLAARGLAMLLWLSASAPVRAADLCVELTKTAEVLNEQSPFHSATGAEQTRITVNCAARLVMVDLHIAVPASAAELSRLTAAYCRPGEAEIDAALVSADGWTLALVVTGSDEERSRAFIDRCPVP